MSITTPITVKANGEGRVVTALVPIAQAFNVTDVSTLRLKSGSTILAAHFKASSRWGQLLGNTSAPLKHVHVTFLDTNSPRTLTVDDGGGSVPATTNPLVLTNNANDMVIDNGLIAVTLNKTANASELMTSFQIGGSERIASGTKPRITVPVEKKTQTTWINSQYDYAAVSGDNVVRVVNPTLFNVGDTVKFAWEGTIAGYLPTGGYQGRAFIVLQQPFSLQEITIGNTPKINLIVNPGGSQEVVECYFSDSQGFHLTTPLGSTPAVGTKVRIQSVEAIGNKTIQAINTGTGDITFTTNLNGVVPQKVDLQPTVAATIDAVMQLNSGGTTISRQYGDGHVIIEQLGVLKDPGSGLRLNDTFDFQLLWHFFSNTDYFWLEVVPRNKSLNPGNPECPDVYFGQMQFRFPTNAASTASSDEVLTENASVTRYKAGTGHVTITHTGITNLKMLVPYMAQKYPKKAEVTAGGEFVFHIFPDTGVSHRFKGSAIAAFSVMIGVNAQNGLPYETSLGVSYDPAYIASSKIIRPNIIEKRNWSTEFAGDPNPLLATAANRYERLVACGYDIDACEDAIAISRPAGTIEDYRTDFPELRPGSYPFGWEKFGNLPWDEYFDNLHYDIPYVLLREACRITDTAKIAKAFQIGFESIRYRITLGQYWSQKYLNGDPSYNHFGMARYERLQSADVFDNYRPPTRSHTWDEGTYLYWALTDHPIAYEAAQAAIACVRQWNYQGTQGARRGGTGVYDLKNPGTGSGADEPRAVGWPILSLIAAYRTFGDPSNLTRAQEYATSFVATQAAETPNDGYISIVDSGSGIEQPLFQLGGYAMHGIIECWRESTGSIKTQIATYIARVANMLYKGDQSALNVTADRPILPGVPHPTDGTKYRPATTMPFQWKRSFADTLASAISAGATTIPLNDASSFGYGLNGNYGVIMPNINNPATWQYFTFTGKSGNTLTGVTGYAGTSIGAHSAGVVVHPAAFPGTLNDLVIATLVAGARITGQQQLQDFAEQIWVDNMLYRDVNPYDFVTVGAYSKINFWPAQYGGSAPKLYGQTATAASEFLGDRVTPAPVPGIASINPLAVAVGAGTTVITLTGINYENNSVVKVNGSNRTTTFVNSTTLTASLPSTDFATPGDLVITVENPTSGNVSSGATLFVRVAPAITSLFPDTKTAGDSSFILVVNGTGFANGAIGRVNGSNRVTTFVNSTRVDVQVPSTDMTANGVLQITVQDGTYELVSNQSPLTVTVQAPTVTSVSPSSLAAGSPQTTVTLTGTNFTPNTVGRVNGSNRATTYVSPTQIQVVLLVGDLASNATLALTAQTPAPGGGTSSGVSLTVGSGAGSAPTLTSISPSATTAGAAQFTLTANGTNFANDAQVLWQGSPLATTFVSATQLTAVVPASLVLAAGSAAVSVRNVTANQTSNALTFTINAAQNPTPVISSISPTSKTAGDAAFTLTVNGTGFVAGSEVRINGNSKPTTFVSSTQLTASIAANDISTAGNKPITVFSPTPGGGTSNAVNLVVDAQAQNPVPTITNISPNQALTGSGQVTVTVTGTNFIQASSVLVNNQARATTYVSPTQLTFVMTSQDIAAAGVKTVRVNNPAPGGGSSNIVNFTVSGGTVVATISNLTPNTVAINSTPTVTVNGTGFTSNSRARVGGVEKTTTFVSATQITFALSSGDTANPALLGITVVDQPGDSQGSNLVSLRVGNLSVSPDSNADCVAVPAFGTQQFTLTGAVGQVVWEASQGQITNTGLFTADGVIGNAVITATDTGTGESVTILVCVSGSAICVDVTAVKTLEEQATSRCCQTVVNCGSRVQLDIPSLVINGKVPKIEKRASFIFDSKYAQLTSTAANARAQGDEFAPGQLAVLEFLVNASMLAATGETVAGFTGKATTPPANVQFGIGINAANQVIIYDDGNAAAATGLTAQAGDSLTVQIEANGVVSFFHNGLFIQYGSALPCGTVVVDIKAGATNTTIGGSAGNVAWTVRTPGSPVDVGTVSAAGLYTAPRVGGDFQVQAAVGSTTWIHEISVRQPTPAAAQLADFLQGGVEAVWLNTQPTAKNGVPRLAADGSPDYWTNPNAVAITETVAGVKFTYKPTYTKLESDRGAIGTVKGQEEGTLELEILQVRKIDLLELILPGAKVVDTPGGRQLQVGGDNCVCYFPITLVKKAKCGGNKYDILHLHRAVSQGDIEYDFKTTGQVSHKLSFQVYRDTSRVNGDQLYSLTFENECGSDEAC